MCSRRHYLSKGTPHLIDLHSIQRCIPQCNVLVYSEILQRPGFRIAATPVSGLRIHHSLQEPNLHRLQQTKSRLTIRLRTATWIPEREEAHRRSFVAHIFVPTPHKPPVLRQESWEQTLYTEDSTNAVAYNLRHFADDILILNGPL